MPSRPPIPPRPPIVTPRPPARTLGPIGTIAPTMTGNQLAQHKAQYLAAHLSPADLSFRYGGLEVVVEEVGFENSCLRLILHATWNGGRIPIDNPFYIYNPPVNIITGYFWTLDETGEPVLAHDTTENPAEALKTVLTQICLGIAGVREE